MRAVGYIAYAHAVRPTDPKGRRIGSALVAAFKPAWTYLSVAPGAI
jgi:hypothetical protein